MFEALRQPKASVYNSLIDACVQCNDLAALKYFHDAMAESLADVVSHNIAIEGRFTAGNSLLCEMRAAGLSEGLITDHSVLNAKLQQGDAREA